MRHLVASLLVVASAGPAATASRTGGGAADQTRISACALLPRELVTKVTSVANKYVLDLPPREEAMGEKGSACDYADIRLQVDPFARTDQLRKSPAKDWQPVAAVGDTAFFHNNRDRYAELMVWTGAHHFTIQMTVPSGSSAEKVKPNTIALANALIPKLK